MSAKQKLKSILKDNVAFKKQKNMTRGDLSHRSLYKVKFSSRVFEKKTLEASKKYNVVFFVDCSGSMSGRNSCIRQCNEALKKLINLFNGIVSIGVYGYNCILHEIHPVGKKIPGKQYVDDICWELLAASAQNIGSPGNRTSYSTYEGPHPTPIRRLNPNKEYNKHYMKGNHDGYLMDQLYLQLQGLKGDTIIVNISDGEPHCDHGCNCKEKGCGKSSKMANDLRLAIAGMKKRKIKLVSLGVANHGVKNFYPVCRTTDKPDDVEQLMVELLQSQFRRG